MRVERREGRGGVLLLLLWLLELEVLTPVLATEVAALAMLSVDSQATTLDGRLCWAPAAV